MNHPKYIIVLNTSDRALRALNISITTSTERLNVDAFYLPHEK